jgi:hypothetical protein
MNNESIQKSEIENATQLPSSSSLETPQTQHTDNGSGKNSLGF